MNVLPSGLPSFLNKKNSQIKYANLCSLFFSNLIAAKAASQLAPFSEKLASYLENSSDANFLRKFHARIFTSGLQDHVFWGSKIINRYAKLGFFTNSRWVFDRIINENLCLWNSLVVGYYRTGQHSEVLNRYLDLRRRKIVVNGSAITFSVKSCSELGRLHLGKGIHLDALKFGLSGDRFVGSSLIGMYCVNGDADSASKVFDEITERDVVAYTSLITGFAESGDECACEAFRIARSMQEEELHPNRVTLVSLLQAAGRLGAFRAGRSIHGYAIRRAIGSSDEVFETSLMDMYIKCRAMNVAASIFGKMSTRSVPSWNALIAGLLQMGCPLEALNLFSLMVQQNLQPDSVTLANVILSCADLKCLREGKSIHGYIIRAGIQLDLVASTALVDTYSKCNSLILARKIFSRMEEKDVVSFNVMMAGCFHNGFAIEAMELFYQMVGGGNMPNASTILSILSAVSALKDVRQGRCIHGYAFRHALELNTEIANQTIHMYAKCGYVESAREVFNRSENKDLVSWTSMMMGYVHQGRADEAIAFFRLMKKEKVMADPITILSLLPAVSQLGCLNLVKEVHSRVYRLAMEQESPIVNSLITTYSKCGKLDMASALFGQICNRSLTSWNTMIAAYGMHGKCMQAIELLDQMEEDDVAPDEVTFTSLISACSHSGLVEQGLRVFRLMKEEYLIIPSEEHYGCVVDLLSRAGRIEEAFGLVNCLPQTYKTSALGTLLAACRIHGNAQMGEVIGRQLLKLEPENPTAYGMVSNLYAEGGKWNDAARIKAMVKDRGLRRTPGYSLIEVDKKQVFQI